ncbi:MAG: LysM peptidoglycan-binding domain-containing protein [Bacteroidales bacterium]|nr:LysM peptidoglycan-binding domain-containing protein [Bacteroidales bacterium]
MAELDKAYRNIDRSANKLVVRNYRQERDSSVQGAGDADSVVRASDPQPQAAAVYHTVRKGDTLGAIARKYHTSVAALCRLNRIKETTLLQIGQRLRVR